VAVSGGEGGGQRAADHRRLSERREAGVDAVRQLEAEWAVLQRGALTAALRDWARSAPALAGFASPDALLAYLHREPPERTDAPLAALLACAAADRRAGRVCLQAILPALKRQATRLRQPPELRDELWALLLGCAWEAICTYPQARRRRVAANLVLEVLHASTRALRRGASPFAAPPPPAQRPLLLGLDEAARVAAPPPPRPGGAEALLAGAVAAGVLAPAEAELILATRLDGVSLRALAAAGGVGYEQLRKRRQRAEARLRASLA
jgi:DNA-directed RNA polymerase specialized sigma24 family protein